MRKAGVYFNLQHIMSKCSKRPENDLLIFAQHPGLGEVRVIELCHPRLTAAE